tara:strand:- start:15902 stop:17857 length:1956 start_codon:yes stop_codon:yes gene_type:complete
MQFKHPEILFALLLLIIPIIIHLFQLQRFTKVPFTNVHFLKRIELQTRKSSQLKKWLILLTRLLAFTAIIFAFSQPYISDFEENQEHNTIIYLDNSLSMQIKGKRGELLKVAIQEIINNIQQNTTYSFITNDHVFKNIDSKQLKNELIKTEYSSIKLNLNTVLLKIEQINLNKINASNNIILISDFQVINKINIQDVTNVNSPIYCVNLTSNKNFNISIDSVFIKIKNNKEIVLKVLINNINTTSESTRISLYNEELLIGKASSALSKNKLIEVEFSIPNQELSNGIIKISDENLTFDNVYFFTISKPKKINILSIGSDSKYLTKIYTKDEFNLKNKTLTTLDYNSIQNQDLIIINEVDSIPTELTEVLNQFSVSGGDLVIIPSSKIDLKSYNQLFSKFNLGAISSSTNKELKITNINYSHPLLNDVFEKQVKNFQYPTVKQQYQIKTTNTTPVLSFENQTNFVTEVKSNNTSTYLFSAPINNTISNFKNSPLIVPLFYNFGKYSYNLPQLSYTIGLENTIEINTHIKKDEILSLENEKMDFIPLQEVQYNKVKLKTLEEPSKSGFYKIKKEQETLRTIAFNYNREENNLNYTDLNEVFKNQKNIYISKSINNTFSQLSKQQEINSIFKWFLALAILFLLLEMCILKFFKV